MKIGILSRSSQLYSTRSLYRAGVRRGHQMQVIDHTRCQYIIANDRLEIYFEDQPLSYLDAIIPRIGSSVTRVGAALIHQFELLNIFTTTRAQALLQARDKLRCLQRLSNSSLQIPKTAFVTNGDDLEPIIEALGGFPIVVKLLESTHGVGVMLLDNYQSAYATIEAFQQLNERVLIQEFIHEAKGADIRALVIGNKVVASMKRQAQNGEFRSNLHRGATAKAVSLSSAEVDAVVKATRTMGLDVAGVDLLQSERGPLIMEVNASPGLEGIERYTRVDVAKAIIQFVERKQPAFKEKLLIK